MIRKISPLILSLSFLFFTNCSSQSNEPTTDKDSIQDSGIAIKELDSNEFIKVENETTIIKISSGTYNFTI